MKSFLCLILISFYTFSATAHSEVDDFITSDTILGTSEQVNYKVIQNHGNIIVKITTQDIKTIMMMMRHGVTVFFDLKGKQKEDVAITYPLEPVRMQMKPQGNPEDNFQSEADIKEMRAQINTLFTEDFPEEALFQLHDSKQQFNVLLNGMGISAAYQYNQQENILTYQLIIPKDKIKEKSKNDFSKLMIGVQTTKPDKSSKSERLEGLENGMSSGIGGGGGNRQQGGGSKGRGGNRGGSRDGGQRSGGDSDKTPQGIDFWFEAHL